MLFKKGINVHLDLDLRCRYNVQMKKIKKKKSLQNQLRAALTKYKNFDGKVGMFQRVFWILDFWLHLHCGTFKDMIFCRASLARNTEGSAKAIMTWIVFPPGTE